MQIHKHWKWRGDGWCMMDVEATESRIKRTTGTFIHRIFPWCFVVRVSRKQNRPPGRPWLSMKRLGVRPSKPPWQGYRPFVRITQTNHPSLPPTALSANGTTSATVDVCMTASSPPATSATRPSSAPPTNASSPTSPTACKKTEWCKPIKIKCLID